MSQKMLIDASHNEETRVVVLESKRIEDFDFESLKKLQLSGNIYLAKVTRVEPSLQAAFLDYGGNRHGFLAFSEIHPDYYQIPLEEQVVVEDKNDTTKTKRATKSRSVSRKKTPNSDSIAEELPADDALIASEILEGESDILLDASVINSTSDEDLVLDPGHTSNYEIIDEDFVAEETLVKKQYRKFRIQEVIKVRQILLIQVVKEERGNKGAALTTYLSLAGRYCVLMPNTPRGGGISRKITNIIDRKRLKEIANSLSVPEGSGLIIRTAGSNRTKLEIKRDYEYLIRQWVQVRDLTLSSIAPTPIYEEGSLIKRAIRDLYSRTIDEILVEGERGYREAKDYMKMLMPSHAKNVKKYEDSTPLFTKFQVEDHIAAMFNPIAQLKSGGYIVIDVTEALVAVDVNSGRATKENSIEDTALKTNLEAAEELVRQIKLRDLAGLIVVDFIDMEDRKNNIAVEKRMKDRLKNDRARTQVGRISIFGLLEMSRQRLRPGMIETTTQACAHCHGTGITRSDDSLSLAILRELEEEGIKRLYKILTLKTPLDIANYMLNEKRENIAVIEKRYDLSIKIEADNLLISPEYKLERIKALNKIPSSNNSIKIDNNTSKDETVSNVVTEIQKETGEPETDQSIEESQSKRRRRRRRRPKSQQQINTDTAGTSTASADQVLSTNQANAGIPKSEMLTKTDEVKEIKKAKPNKKINKLSNEIVDNIDEPSEPNVDLSKKVTPKPKSKRRPVKIAQKKQTLESVKNEPENKQEDGSDISTNDIIAGKEPYVSKTSQSKRRGWWSRSKKTE